MPIVQMVATYQYDTAVPRRFRISGALAINGTVSSHSIESYPNQRRLSPRLSVVTTKERHWTPCRLGALLNSRSGESAKTHNSHKRIFKPQPHVCGVTALCLLRCITPVDRKG